MFSRAQNRGFCAFFAFGTALFGLFEHKIGIFVRFLPLEPPFSGISSTKSGFLCAFTLRPPVFRPSEHKIEVFVSEMAIFPWIYPLPSTKSAFLCSRGGESGIRKRNRGDAYPSCKSPRTLPKFKYLITKQLTFAVVLGEHKLVAPSTLPLARSACGGTQRGR